MARGLDSERQQRLRRLAALFLARKRFLALAGAVLDDYWRLLIAMQACLPALQQGAGSLRGWREVLIYPGEFKVRGSHHACHSSVLRAGDDTRSVDTWERGPLVLSLADVQLDLEQPWDGYNVVLHQMAHKLDILDGPADGIPPLTDIPRRRWVEQFGHAYHSLANTPAQDCGNPIDHYAAENPSEYFAVVTELHYSQPTLLREADRRSPTCWKRFTVHRRRWRANYPTSFTCAESLPRVNLDQVGVNVTLKRAPPSSAERSTSSSPW